ncbi:hypothetical protein [Streptomyces sp. NPDC127092]|uniref:nuclear transport factor 2 family protein n=1 Tax=Streptomyces sp. NPDC127092 TaxID=3347135 RepID=UPI00364AEE8B
MAPRSAPWCWETASARDHVILHCHQTWHGGEDYAGIDIFRFDADADADGKILEHWDALQVIPPTSENDNTMF